MKKILLLAASKNTSYQLLAVELLTRLHLDCQASLFSDLEFRFTSPSDGIVAGGLEIYAGQKPVSDFDLVYVITIGKFKESLLPLSSYLNRHHIPIVDSIFSGGNYLEVYKLSQVLKLTSAGLPCLKTFAGIKLDSAIKFFDIDIHKPFQLVAKNSLLDRGEGIFLVTNLSELEDCLNQGFLIQEYLPEKLDLRVIVVGHTALGCVRRTPVLGEFRSNIGHDAIAEVYPLSPELAELAIKATAAAGLDIAGVDILVGQDGKKYILEVNHSPQYAYDADPFFLNFMKLTGVNVTAKIADFLESKLATKGVSFRV